jgi:hypothetical protein
VPVGKARGSHCHWTHTARAATFSAAAGRGPQKRRRERGNGTADSSADTHPRGDRGFCRPAVPRGQRVPYFSRCSGTTQLARLRLVSWATGLELEVFVVDARFRHRQLRARRVLLRCLGPSQRSNLCGDSIPPIRATHGLHASCDSQRCAEGQRNTLCTASCSRRLGTWTLLAFLALPSACGRSLARGVLASCQVLLHIGTTRADCGTQYSAATAS